MFGLNKSQFIGRLARDITLQVGGEDEVPYCYFTLAIPQGKKTDASGKSVDRDPLWVDFSAKANLAKYISTYGKKGMWIYVEGKLSRKQKISENNGEKVVYNDVVFRASEIIILPSGTKDDQTGKNEASAVPAASDPESVVTRPEDDLTETEDGLFASLTAKERAAAGELPF